MPPPIPRRRRLLAVSGGVVCVVATCLLLVLRSSTIAFTTTPSPPAGVWSATTAPLQKSSRGSSTATIAAGNTSCSSATTCLSCLFTDGRAAKTQCVWCASTSRCELTENACPDIEDTSCPAVLHTPIPQTFRVIHVAIRKGGPEALVQLHLALNHWGFKTTLDTRKSKKQKGGPVVPFFMEVYATEFAKAPPLRWEANYDAWLESAAEGDVMIATETWTCKNNWTKEAERGARQMQWHLTVWPKKPRTACTIAGHTNHISQDYMKAPRRAVLFPYISPHIVALAKRREAFLAAAKAQGELVMYDGDVKLTDAEVRPAGASWQVRKATGFTPAELYLRYAQAKVGIDLNLPGAERFVYEASLFDVCIIVDKQANGADPYDLPLPDRFRVQPNSLPALHERIDECLKNYDAVIQEQRPLKEHTLQQRDAFHRHVRRYFSNSVHVVTFFATTAEATAYFTSFMLHTLLAIPFASVEIRYAPGVQFPQAARATLRDHSYLAAVSFVEAGSARYATATRPSRVAFVMFVPPTTALVAGDIVHLAGSALALMRDAQSGHHVVVASKQGFAMIGAKAVPTFADCARESSSDVVACLAKTKGGLVLDLDLEWTSEAAEAVSAALVTRENRSSPPPILALANAAPESLPGLLHTAGRVRAVERNAGDSLSVGAYLCTHPLYAELLPAVCAYTG
jgi:hypothetical protein